MKKLILTLCLLILSKTTLAYEPIIACGGSPGQAALEVDEITIERGGYIETQIVLRNEDIIRDFISKQAIYGAELNPKGEFIVTGAAVTTSVPETYFTEISKTGIWH